MEESSTGSKGPSLNESRLRPNPFESNAPADRQAWLSKLAAALEGARELLVQLEDGPATNELIERIDELREEVSRNRTGSIDAIGQDHPIWTELDPWISKIDQA